MGLFKHKKEWPINESPDGLQDYFDEYFLELRSRGQLYFEKTIEEKSAKFQKDLDATLAKVNDELKDYVSKQIDSQLADFGKMLKDTQAAAIKALDEKVDALKEQHQKLGDDLKKNIDYQEAIFNKAFEESTSKLSGIKDAQESALQTLSKSVEDLQAQHTQIGEMLEKNIKAEQEIITKAFEDNMAKIIEHYLLGTLGDQYDFKAQLPAIIKQMEDNKQAIVDDIKL